MPVSPGSSITHDRSDQDPSGGARAGEGYDSESCRDKDAISRGGSESEEEAEEARLEVVTTTKMEETMVIVHEEGVTRFKEWVIRGMAKDKCPMSAPLYTRERENESADDSVHLLQSN